MQEIQIPMSAIFARKGTMTESKNEDGSISKIEPPLLWAHIVGIIPDDAKDPEYAGSREMKIKCSHSVYDEARKILVPGQSTDVVLKCEMRPGQKNIPAPFAISILPAK